MTLLRRLAAISMAAAFSVTLAVSLAGTAAAFEPVPPPEAYPERILGQDDAPVTIVEYSSLTCPHCANFHADVLPQIKKEFIDTGRARLVYRDFPLDNLALGAAVVARCAPEGMYFPLLDMLFANQQDWARSGNPLESIMGYGRLAGLTSESVQACFDDEALVRAVQEAREQGNAEYGITSTPSFVIEGEVVAGNQGYDRFADIIRRHESR